MLRDPLAVQKLLATHFRIKKFAKPEKYLEPLDLTATVGQSCVCVCESERRRTTLWWRVVEVSTKKHNTKQLIYQSHPLTLSL